MVEINITEYIEECEYVQYNTTYNRVNRFFKDGTTQSFIKRFEWCVLNDINTLNVVKVIVECYRFKHPVLFCLYRILFQNRVSIIPLAKVAYKFVDLYSMKSLYDNTAFLSIPSVTICREIEIDMSIFDLLFTSKLISEYTNNCINIDINLKSYEIVYNYDRYKPDEITNIYKVIITDFYIIFVEYDITNNIIGLQYSINDCSDTILFAITIENAIQKIRDYKLKQCIELCTLI